MIKAVIFDMDGLMVETEFLHSQSYAAVLENLGKKPELNESGVIHKVGARAVENWQILKEKYQLEETVEILRIKKWNIYWNLLKTNKVKAMPGLKKLMDSLIKSNIKIAIASSASRKSIQLILENIKLHKTFEFFLGLEDVEKAKPQPDLYLEAVKRLHVKPEECLALEDSRTGVEAAYSAGIKVIAVPSKYTKNQDFTKASKIISSLNNITLSLLKKL